MQKSKTPPKPGPKGPKKVQPKPAAPKKGRDEARKPPLGTVSSHDTVVRFLSSPVGYSERRLVVSSDIDRALDTIGSRQLEAGARGLDPHVLALLGRVLESDGVSPTHQLEVDLAQAALNEYRRGFPILKAIRDSASSVASKLLGPVSSRHAAANRCDVDQFLDLGDPTGGSGVDTTMLNANLAAVNERAHLRAVRDSLAAYASHGGRPPTAEHRDVQANGRSVTISGATTDAEIDNMTKVPVMPSAIPSSSLVRSVGHTLLAAPAAVGAQVRSEHSISTGLMTPYGAGTRLRGREVFATLQQGNGTSPGHSGSLVVVSPGGRLIPVDNDTAGARQHFFGISPVDIGGRPREFAQLFLRSHVHKFRVLYVPGIATTDSRSVAICATDDARWPKLVTEGPSGTGTGAVPDAELYGFFMANDNAVMSPVWQPASVDWNMRGGMSDQENWLYNYTEAANYGDFTSADARQHAAGAIGVCTDRPGTSSSVLGHIVIEYDFVFADPSPDLSAYLPSWVAINAGPGRSLELAHAIRRDPIPLFECLEKYGIGTNVKSRADVELLEHLRALGLPIPPERELSKYDQWRLAEARASTALK